MKNQQTLRKMTLILLLMTLFFSTCAFAEGYPLLRPENVESDDGIVLHKQAMRTGPEEWTVDVTVSVSELNVEAPKLEVVFVLDASSTMNACTEEEVHNSYAIDFYSQHQCTEKCADPCAVEWEYHVTGTPGHPCQQFGSNFTNATNYETRFSVAKKAITQLVNTLPDDTPVKYAYFSGTQTNHAANSDVVNDLNDIPYANGQTYLMLGVDLGVNAFSDDNTKKILVIVTDGMATDDRYTSDDFENFKAQGGMVFTVGFNHVDSNLQGMTANGGSYFHAGNPGELTKAFDQIGLEITAMVIDPMGINVNFNPKSLTVQEGNLTTTGKTISWTPGDEQVLTGEIVNYTYKVTLDPDAERNIKVYEKVPLNNPTLFRYGISKNGVTQMHEMNFPIPQATYAYSSIQVKWQCDGEDIKTPTAVERIVCDYGEPAFQETNYREHGDMTVNGVEYTYSHTTVSPNGFTIDSVDPSQPVAYEVIHHYTKYDPSLFGDLKITKAVEGGVQVPADTEFVITDSQNYQKAVKYSEFVDGAYTLSKLPIGMYTVTEKLDKAAVEKYSLTVMAGDEQINSTAVQVTGAATVTAAFKNIYTRTVGNLSISKTVVNGDPNKAFTFTVTPAENSGVSEAEWNDYLTTYYSGTVCMVLVKHGETVTIPYLPTGKYVVAEEAAPGYTPNAASQEVEVTINGASAAFENTYSATGTSITFSGIKTLNGRTLTANDRFTFEITEGDKLIGRATNDATGKINYPTINYTSADVGTHIYEVRETGSYGDSITTDPTVYEVTVTVSDNGEGALSAVADDNAYALNFTNTYSANGELLIEGRKYVNGSEPADNEVFAFELRNEAGSLLQTVENSGSLITFDPIRYTLADAGKTFLYTVKEITESSVLYETDTKVYTLSVRVTDGGEGELELSQQLTCDGAAAEAIVFNNISHLYDTVDFTVTKEWHGGEGGVILLTLYADGEAMEPQPRCLKEGNVYSYSGLPKYTAEGQQITYFATETSMEGYMTAYRNIEPYEAETDKIYDGGTIVNHKIPETGDNSRLGLWLIATIAAAFGCVTILKKSKRA